MKKITLLLLAVLLIVSLAACQPAAPAEEPAAEEPAAEEPAAEEPMEEEEMAEEKPVYRIGYIQTSPDAYYQMQADALKYLMSKAREAWDDKDRELANTLGVQ